MKIIAALLLCFTSIFGYSQNAPHVELRNDQVTYGVGYAGSPKAWGFTSTAIMDVPDSILVSSGFAKFLWLMGIRDDVPVQRSVHDYRQEGKQFVAGVLEADGMPYSGNATYFDRIWKVRGDDVRNVINLYQDGSLTIDDIPADILTWPAMGNPYFIDSMQSILVNQKLAPFVDINDDGAYDPLAGDYPVPLQEKSMFIPHEFTFHCFHDVTPRDSTDYPPLHVQLAHIAVLTNCSDYSDLSSSVYHRLELKETHTESIDQIRFGIYDDEDIGEAWEDIAGFNLQANASYSFGGGEPDQREAVEMPKGYGAVQSTMYISHEVKTYAPVWPRQERFLFDNALQGMDPDTNVAINPVTGDTTAHWYTGDPLVENGWVHSGYIDKGSCSVLELPANSSQKHIVEFIEAIKYDVVASSAVEVMDDHTQHLLAIKTQWDERIMSPDCLDPEEYSICNSDCVWPGDIDGDSIVTSKDFLLEWDVAAPQGTEILGPQRELLSGRWHPMTADDWDADVESYA